jgi:hypothetical protein
MAGRRGRMGSWARRMLWAAAIAVPAAPAPAQTLENLSLARTYGAGVHAYFSGDFDRSYDELTAAVEAGSEDPRTRYFRGLAALRLGRLDEAEADFSEGADLEARALGGWPVSRSLERVQGHDRLRLERHRVRARVAALQRDRAAEQRRYSGIEDAQPEVLRRRGPAVLPGPTGGAANPFVEERPAPAATLPEPAPTPEPAPEPPAEATPQPAAEAEPAAGGTELDPVMESPAQPAAEPPVDIPPQTPVEEPPVAAEPAAPVSPEVPAEPAAPAAEEDPFGDKTAAEPAAEAAPVE